MKRILFSIAALCAASTSASAVEGEDIWSGHYWGDCGNTVYCSMEITNGLADKVDVALIVKNQTGETTCKLSGKFIRTGIIFIEGKVPKAGNVGIGATATGMEVFGVPKKACGVKFGGTFQPMGD